MKYIILIGDGTADLPIEALGGKTPLEYAKTPNLDAISAKGVVGRSKNVPDGVPAGSDTAILSIFGCDPNRYYTGRSPLEAAGAGVSLKEGEISFRTNVVSLGDEPEFLDKTIYSHNGGNVEGEESIQLMQALLADPAFCALAAKLQMRFQLSCSFRHVSVIRGVDAVPAQTPPHDILGRRIGDYLRTDPVSQMLVDLMRRAFEVMDGHPVNAARRAAGKLPANCLWFWGEGKAVTLPDFYARYGKSACVITAVPLVVGIAALCGVPSIDVPGATGDLDTNYLGKAQAALEALHAGKDLAIVHVEAPDECSHAGDLNGKIQAIEQIDDKVLGTLLKGMEGEPMRLLYLSDHPTLMSTRTHDGAPVPYVLYDSRVDTGLNRPFGETTAAQGGLIDPGTRLLSILFEQEPQG
jgi:2,3-bisphosphoglycerate-independent phosphoglycerate mutase